MNTTSTTTPRTIDFVDNATTREALVYTLRYAFVFCRGVCRAADAFVRRLPWLCLGLTALAAVAVSFVFISSARAERDSACKRMARLQQQVEQLSCALEARREAAR